MNKLVSIIVPIYNVAPYLQATLDSIENQTYKNTEIILVDDGSTDNPQPLLKLFCSRHKNAKLIVQKNKGLAGARNTGYKYATGELVYFYDSDDLLHPKMIEFLVNGIISNDADVSICSFKKFKDGEKPKYKFKSSKIKIVNGSDNIALEQLWGFVYDWMVWNKMYKKEIVDKVCENGKPFSEEILFGEDAVFFLKYMSKVEKAILSKNKLYGYRQRKASLVHQTFNKNKLTFFRNINWFNQLADAFPNSKFNVYDRFAHQIKDFLHDMMKTNWDRNDIEKGFNLYRYYFSKSIWSKYVPWYRKLDLSLSNPCFSIKVKRYLKKH